MKYHKYANILSPVKVGNLILKNRLINSKSMPNVGEPAPYPTEELIVFASGLAKNGASIVTCSPGMYKQWRGRTFFTSEFDMDDREVQTQFKKMIDRIHYYGSYASASTMCYVPTDMSISDIRDFSKIPAFFPPGPEGIYDRDGNIPPEISKEQIKEFIESFTQCCVKLKDVGFDMINIYMSYNASMLAKSLSPILNQRTDEYGGSLENRARLVRELLASIKNACGRDFPIEIQISGREQLEGGFTESDFVEYCKLFEEYVDIFQVRAWCGDQTHTSSYLCSKDNPTNLKFATLLKENGIKKLVAPVGGFQDLDVMDKVLGEGKTDLIALARAFICDDEFGKKLIEARNEDITPCIRCDKCHGGVCSVNPKMGLSHAIPNMYEKPSYSKKVAVIGGGPSGLKAAALAAQRGHKVTLYEKNTYLGGQLHHADFMYDKWSLRDFKDWLVRQAVNSGVQIKLGVEVTPEAIASRGYDAVIAACGSVPKKSAIAGAQLAWDPIDVFGREAELGKNVVVVGGAMVAVDTALYLAHSGHKVTIITRQREAAYDYEAHSSFAFKDQLKAEPNITIITEAQTELVESDGVTYTAAGNKSRVACDSVVISAGRVPLRDECFAFAGTAPQYYVVGDAWPGSNARAMGHHGPGGDADPNKDTTDNGVRNSMITAFAAANSI